MYRGDSRTAGQFLEGGDLRYYEPDRLMYFDNSPLYSYVEVLQQNIANKRFSSMEVRSTDTFPAQTIESLTFNEFTAEDLTQKTLRAKQAEELLR